MTLKHATPYRTLSLGDDLRRLRESRGLTQRHVSKLTGGEVSAASLSRLETGDRYPTLHTLEALATALGCWITIGPAGTELTHRRL